MILLALQIVAIAAHGDQVAIAKQEGVTLDGKSVVTSVAQIAGVAFARDGALAIFGGKPGKSGEFELVGKWKSSEHKDLVNAVAFGLDWVATASHDRTIRVHALDGKLLRTLTGHASSVVSLAASPDGKLLASGGADSTIRLWDLAGTLLRTIANHGDRVNALAWSPDGKYLASASRDRTLRVWQPEIGRLVRIVKHDAELLDVAWRDQIATACADGKVRLIESDSDKVLQEWTQASRVSNVAITKEGVLAAEEGKVTLLRK